MIANFNLERNLGARMNWIQVKKLVILLFGFMLIGVGLLSCSVEPKEKPKSLVESQQKVLEGAKSIEAQLKAAEAKRLKEMDSQ